MSKDKKTVMCRFRVNSKMLRCIDGAVCNAGMNRSAYIRKKIDECEVFSAPDIDCRAYCEELKKVGRELNNLLILLQWGGVIRKQELDDTMNRLDELINRLKAISSGKQKGEEKNEYQRK